MSVRLPVRPTIRPGEDIAYFLARCAELNGMHVRSLTGHSVAARIWEDPPEPLLTHITDVTATPTSRLREATVRALFPEVTFTRSRAGSRYLSHLPSCSRCRFSPTAARLNVVVLCPNCGSLLADDSDSRPLIPPAGLAEIQADVSSVLRGLEEGREASSRIDRLEALMRAQEAALWQDSPPLCQGETHEWRESVSARAQRLIDAGGRGPRPPSLTAALLLLCWPASATAEETQTQLADCAITSDPTARRLSFRDEPEREREAALAELHEEIRRRAIRLEHLPNALPHRGEHLIIEPRVLGYRSAQSLALAVVTSGRFRSWMGDEAMCEAAKDLGHHVPLAVRDAAQMGLLHG